MKFQNRALKNISSLLTQAVKEMRTVPYSHTALKKDNPQRHTSSSKKKKKLVVLVKNLRLEKKEKEHLVLCKVDTAVNIHHCLQL